MARKSGYPAPVRLHGKVRSATRNISKAEVSSVGRFKTPIPKISGFNTGKTPKNY